MDNNNNILRVRHNLDASEHTQLLRKYNSVHTIRTVSLNTSTGMYWIIGPFKNPEPVRFYIKNYFVANIAMRYHFHIEPEYVLTQSAILPLQMPSRH